MSAPSAEHTTDVLVIGGGPTGLAGAIELASSGISTTVVESRSGPRREGANAALTPRAVSQLADIADLDAVKELPSSHATSGIRVLVHGRAVELPWPANERHTVPGMVVARHELDDLLHHAAVASGARVWTGTTATAPLVDDGIVSGATLEQALEGGDTSTIHLRASYVLIADGALSHFGRALGTARNRSYPMGLVARTRLVTSAADDDWMEAAIDLHDQHGAPIPGLGWVLPGKTDAITVGVGLLTAFRETEGPPINDLLTSWVRRLPGHWGIDAEDIVASDLEIESGRVPLGGSVHPKSGPNWLVAGDAAGLSSPISGAGLESALETGRIAGGILAEAFSTGDGLVLRRFESYLESERGSQLRVARLAARAVARPRIARPLTSLASRSPAILGGALRIVTGVLREDSPGRAEHNFALAARLASIIPDRTTG